MAETSYLDFDLSIERLESGGYRTRVLFSPAGQASGNFVLPFSDVEIENIVLRLGQARRRVRRIDSPELESVKTFGGRLYKALFQDQVQSCLRSSLEQARQQGYGLRIRMRLTEAPELLDLPWEFLYDGSLNRFLSLSINTPIVRFLDLPERITPLAVTPPIKVLVIISSPQDYPELDVEREWELLKEAVSGLEKQGLINLVRLEKPTALALQQQLRREKYNVIHFIGHGGFDEGAQDGVLMMEDENGRGRAIGGQFLGAVLHDEQTLRLVVLNACEGARTSRSDPFSGTAQSLVQQGIPAIIAMQFEVSDEAAIIFAREFYMSLADGYPVDAALAEARKAVFTAGNGLEWGTPVLYMRAPDGQIFSIEHSLTRTDYPVSEGSLAFKEPKLAKPGAQEFKTSEANLPPASILKDKEKNQRTPTHVIDRTQDTQQPQKRRKVLLLISGGILIFLLVFGVGTGFNLLFNRNDQRGVLQDTVHVSPAISATVQVALITIPENHLEGSPSPIALLPQIVDNAGVSMVLVPAGEFQMGREDNEAYKDGPIHTVYLDDYYIDQYEVTNNRYRTCVEKGVCKPPRQMYSTNKRPNYYEAYSDYPVLFVDWYDADTYCRWRGARLPTEAEWEKAASPPTDGPYPWGLVTSGSICDYANFNRCVGDTTQVGSYPKGVSRYNVYDLAGNVWEWVADWFDEKYYTYSPRENPTGPESGTTKVFRGGSWYHVEDNIRRANRASESPEYFSDVNGFRCARNP